MKGFLSVGGWWWDYSVHVTVKGCPFFSPHLFSVVSSFVTLRGVLFYGISVYSVTLFLCTGVLLSLFCCLQRPGVIFLFFRSLAGGIRLVQAREKKTFYLIFFVVFYCLL